MERTGAPAVFGSLGFAVAAVAVDFCAAMALHSILPGSLWASYGIRACLVAVFAVLAASKRGAADLGFRLGRPGKGARNAGIIVLGVSVLLVTGWLGALLLKSASGVDIVDRRLAAPITIEAAVLGCVAAPLQEETLYRGILYGPLERTAGAFRAIVLSGLVFQGLHFAYGIYYPHYLVGGMLLAWSFRESRTLVFPVLLHALWNLAVMIFWALAARF